MPQVVQCLLVQSRFFGNLLLRQTFILACHLPRCASKKERIIAMKGAAASSWEGHERGSKFGNDQYAIN